MGQVLVLELISPVFYLSLDLYIHHFIRNYPFNHHFIYPSTYTSIILSQTIHSIIILSIPPHIHPSFYHKLSIQSLFYLVFQSSIYFFTYLLKIQVNISMYLSIVEECKWMVCTVYIWPNENESVFCSCLLQCTHRSICAPYSVD